MIAFHRQFAPSTAQAPTQTFRLLRDAAQAQNLEGWAKMRKDELVQAVRGGGR